MSPQVFGKSYKHKYNQAQSRSEVIMAGNKFISYLQREPLALVAFILFVISMCGIIYLMLETDLQKREKKFIYNKCYRNGNMTPKPVYKY